MSDKKKRGRKLSLEETVQLLGAEQPEDFGPVHLDPLGMQFLAARVVKRLVRGRGRPTDPSWDIVRKIPMKKETWEFLTELSRRLTSNVAPGQMAAIALERGVEGLRHDATTGSEASEDSPYSPSYSFAQESLEEAELLSVVISKERFW